MISPRNAFSMGILAGFLMGVATWPWLAIYNAHKPPVVSLSDKPPVVSLSEKLNVSQADTHYNVCFPMFLRSSADNKFDLSHAICVGPDDLALHARMSGAR
jgi:hypothetical protein